VVITSYLVAVTKGFKAASKAFSGFVKDLEILFKTGLSQASMREFHGAQ
jgi:hypothetical protein